MNECTHLNVEAQIVLLREDFKCDLWSEKYGTFFQLQAIHNKQEQAAVV